MTNRLVGNVRRWTVVVKERRSPRMPVKSPLRLAIAGTISFAQDVGRRRPTSPRRQRRLLVCLAAPAVVEAWRGCLQPIPPPTESAMTPLRRRMLEDMQVRNLSPHTQASYLQHVSLFARRFGQSPAALGPEDIRAYLVYLTTEKKPRPGRSTSPRPRCASSTRSRSSEPGRSTPSSRRPRSLRPCTWC